jgi:hypothetical protein
MLQDSPSLRCGPSNLASPASPSSPETPPSPALQPPPLALLAQAGPVPPDDPAPLASLSSPGGRVGRASRCPMCPGDRDCPAVPWPRGGHEELFGRGDVAVRASCGVFWLPQTRDETSIQGCQRSHEAPCGLQAMAGVNARQVSRVRCLHFAQHSASVTSFATPFSPSCQTSRALEHALSFPLTLSVCVCVRARARVYPCLAH